MWMVWRHKLNDRYGQQGFKKLYLDLADGYLSIYTCQNSFICTLRFVPLIGYTSIKKITKSQPYLKTNKGMIASFDTINKNTFKQNITISKPSMNK